MEKKKFIIYLFLSIMLFSIIFILFIVININKIPAFFLKIGILKPESESDILNWCDNMPLEITSYCLRDSIKTFFYYNISEYDRMSVTPTFERLNNVGGVCEDWSNYYKHLIEELKYNARTVIIEYYDEKEGKNLYHQYTIAYDEDNSCKLDQLKVECYK